MIFFLFHIEIEGKGGWINWGGGGGGGGGGGEQRVCCPPSQIIGGGAAPPPSAPPLPTPMHYSCVGLELLSGESVPSAHALASN